MKRSNRLVLLIGIFLALVAFVLIVILLGGTGGGGGAVAPSASPTTAKVVVATANIDLGARIEASDVGLKEIPLNAKPADAYLDTALVIGEIARKPVRIGELIDGKVLGGGGSITDIEVPAGFVAMSVRVDQTTGVGTVVKPGDFVDVVTGFTTTENVKVVTIDPEQTSALRESLDDNEAFVWTNVPNELFNETTVKVLAQGLQVLGTLLPPPPQQQQQDPQATPVPGGNTGTTTLNGQEQIVILAVPTQVAEVIKFSQIDGDISLVLRSSADCTTEPSDGLTYCPAVATTGMTLRRIVDDFGVLPPTMVQVIQPTPLPGTIPENTPRP